MPRKKTGLASSTKKRYIKSTCHCLILCQNIVGGLYTIISEGKFTQSYADNTACKSNYNMLHFFYVTQDIMSVSEGEHAFMLIPNGE